MTMFSEVQCVGKGPVVFGFKFWVEQGRWRFAHRFEHLAKPAA